MSDVALAIHGGRPEAVDLARTVAGWLVSRGHSVLTEAEESTLLADVPHRTATVGSNVDLVVAIGGDGTVLRGARRAMASDADVLGMNLGELGYLAEVEPDGWEDALTAYFEGAHRIEERMLVRTTRGDGVELPAGLNEVVIEKQSLGRIVRLGVSIDGEFFTSYVADGVIVATPTGSTAYSLSARGPIVAPSHRALVMTPVSPHTLFDRSLVLEPTSRVELTVLGDLPAMISVDGQEQGPLAVGESVAITGGLEPVRFVTFGGRSFHQILKAKFGLNDR